MPIAGKITSVVPANAPVAPLGSPDTARLTAPVKPLAGVTVMPSVPPMFCGNVNVVEAGLRLNPGDVMAVTVNVTGAVSVRVPEVPMMVMG